MRRVIPPLLLWLLALSGPFVFSQNSDLERLVQGNTRFAIDLYQSINSEKKNLVFSPYSISLIMAMVYGGARGEIASQMVDVLRFPIEDEQLHYAFAEIQGNLREIQDAEKLKGNS